MKEEDNFVPINEWAEEDRPREKLQLKGKDALSDAELIAILLRTGMAGKTALDVAKNILRKVNNNLDELSKLGVDDMLTIEKGIGKAKAITLVAAMELGRRLLASEVRQRAAIRGSRDAFHYVYPQLADLPNEVFYCLYLNRKNEVISMREISTGGVSGTVADVRIILKHAIQLLASGIVAVHNHPSGNLSPSEADIKLTEQLKASAKLMGITLIDHIIVGNRNEYYSFADAGML
ncbi:MAG: DNA repair protein RadC [Chitinophagales bacterium]|nr:DNA repair protein RadC [Chitinophagales bacterium]MDW8419008.1 DNA repair protein RadC [Chitinophagales bacterium]